MQGGGAVLCTPFLLQTHLLAKEEGDFIFLTRSLAAKVVRIVRLCISPAPGGEQGKGEGSAELADLRQKHRAWEPRLPSGAQGGAE